LIAAVIATVVVIYGDINYIKKGPGFLGSIWLAVACSIYTIIANAAYIWLGVKGNLKLSGGSISHVGFGLVLLGILLSSSKKEILSNNINGIPAPLGEKEDPRENLTLIKGVPVKMGKYTLTYVRDSTHPKKQLWFYQIDFKSNDGKEEFSLLPNAFVNYKGQEGLMANPDARHYWDHDVFTYITSLPNPDKKPDSSAFQPHSLKEGDSLFYSKGFILVEAIRTKEAARPKDSIPEDLFGKEGKLYEADLKIYSKTGSIFSTTPKLALAKGELVAIPDTIIAENLILQLSKVNPDKSIELGMRESNALTEYVTLKAYKFPFIRILWLGVLITATGILISMVRRIQLNRRTASGS
jgi:cytochrome c-type biogenesis protein CcmF